MDTMSKRSKEYVHTQSLSGENSSDDVPMDVFHTTVKDKWQGTAADKHDMIMLGRSQVLRVRDLDTMLKRNVI